jgi:ATP-dependent helicase/nuclease subunit B
MLLERFMMKICEEGEMRLDITDEERDEIIDKLIDDYIRSVFRDRRSAPARLLTLISRLRRTAILLITDILEEFSQSDFRPAFFELGIGSEGENSLESYVIKTPEGGDIRLYGKVDRVDTYKKGDDVYVRIVDYKTGSHDISLKDVEKGHELQMLLYLFAIWKSADKDFIEKIGAENGEIYPAGVQYYKVKMPEITMSGKPESEHLKAELQKKLERTGLSLDDVDIISAANRMGGTRYSPGEMLTLGHFGDLVNQVEEIVNDITGQMRSGSAKAEWKNPDKEQCSYCSMQPICRKGKNNG